MLVDTCMQSMRFCSLKPTWLIASHPSLWPENDAREKQWWLQWGMDQPTDLLRGSWSSNRARSLADASNLPKPILALAAASCSGWALALVLCKHRKYVLSNINALANQFTVHKDYIVDSGAPAPRTQPVPRLVVLVIELEHSCTGQWGLRESATAERVSVCVTVCMCVSETHRPTTSSIQSPSRRWHQPTNAMDVAPMCTHNCLTTSGLTLRVLHGVVELARFKRRWVWWVTELVNRAWN